MLKLSEFVQRWYHLTMTISSPDGTATAHANSNIAFIKYSD